MPLLFQTTTELKQYINVSGDLQPATFLPSMQKAEDVWISVVLGPAQYADLVTAYNANTLSTIQSNLLDQVRKAEASLGMYLLLPILGVRIGDAGLMTAGGVDQQRALQWQNDDLRNQLLYDGYNALDNLYNFLFANQSLYPDWVSSVAYTQFTQYFINRVADFQAQVDIDNSNWIFRKLVPLMNNIEQNAIIDTIGEPFFTYLKEQIAADTLAGPDIIAVQYIQEALARLTMARALMDPNLTEVFAIFLRGRTDAQDRRKWEKADYTVLQIQYAQEGESMLLRAKMYFNTTATGSIYAAYFTSDRYRAPKPSDKNKHDEYDNRNSKGSFFMFN